MNLYSYLELSSGKFELLHIIRRFLTNVFVFKDSNIKGFIETNNIPKKYESGTYELLKSYSTNYKELEIETSAAEIELIQEKLRTPISENATLAKIHPQVFLLYSEDAESFAQGFQETFSGKYTFYKDCVTKENYHYHNKAHFNSILNPTLIVLIIIFSKELNLYWPSLGFTKTLLENADKLGNRLYVYNTKESYIPDELEVYFPASKSSIHNSNTLSESIKSKISLNLIWPKPN